MTRRGMSAQAAALLPWAAAAVLWFVWLQPLRAGQATRLADQAQIRRERLKAEQAARGVDNATKRITESLGAACKASSDPAALRQRSIAATSGLSLSPLTLSVMGSPAAGAVVDAEGSRGAILELARRLGDPARGGFLRSVVVRLKASRFGLGASTGVFESFAPLAINLPACAGKAEMPPPETPTATPTPVKPKPMPRPTPEIQLPAPTPFVETPPFTLVAFLKAEGRSRISVRVGEQIRVVSVGEVVNGWRCESIDRDEGAAFTSPSGTRAVLKLRPSDF